jgi:hypothetical protein
MLDFSLGLFRIQHFNFTAPIGSGAGIIGASNPVGLGITAGVSALSGVTNLFSKLNHPYGTCSTTAPDADSFRACWSHPVGPDFIPYMEGAPRGWSFAWCRGARSLLAPEGGCAAPCDCSTRACVCAPTGAVKGLPDGTFVDAKGKNLGGPVQKADYVLSDVAKEGKAISLSLLGIAGIGGLFFIPRLLK